MAVVVLVAVMNHLLKVVVFFLVSFLMESCLMWPLVDVLTLTNVMTLCSKFSWPRGCAAQARTAGHV